MGCAVCGWSVERADRLPGRSSASGSRTQAPAAGGARAALTGPAGECITVHYAVLHSALRSAVRSAAVRSAVQHCRQAPSPCWQASKRCGSSCSQQGHHDPGAVAGLMRAGVTATHLPSQVCKHAVSEWSEAGRVQSLSAEEASASHAHIEAVLKALRRTNQTLRTLAAATSAHMWEFVSPTHTCCLPCSAGLACPPWQLCGSFACTRQPAACPASLDIAGGAIQGVISPARPGLPQAVHSTLTHAVCIRL